MSDKPYHHGDLRQSLIDAGLCLARDEGPGAVRPRAAARIAGVSHGAPARHFANAADFIGAVAAAVVDLLTEAMSEARREAPDATSAFVAVGHAYVQFVTEETALFRLMEHTGLDDPGSHPNLRDASARSFQVLLGAVVDAQEAGAVRHGDPMPIALTAWAAMHGLATLIAGDALTAKGYSDQPGLLATQLTDTLALGFAPRP